MPGWLNFILFCAIAYGVWRRFFSWERPEVKKALDERPISAGFALHSMSVIGLFVSAIAGGIGVGLVNELIAAIF